MRYRDPVTLRTAALRARMTGGIGPGLRSPDPVRGELRGFRGSGEGESGGGGTRGTTKATVPSRRVGARCRGRVGSGSGRLYRSGGGRRGDRVRVRRQHQHARRLQYHHQRCLPGGQSGRTGLHLGFAGDVEYTEQAKAIRLFVDQVNNSGGINGRRINPIIATFDPTNECRDAGIVQGLDRGEPGASSPCSTVWGLDGRQPAVHHPGGSHPLPQPVDHGDQLDRWLAVPVVDRPDDAAVLQAPVDWGPAPGLLGGNARSGSSPATGPATSGPATTTCCPTSSGSGSPRWSRPSPPIPPRPPRPASEAPLIVQKLRRAGVTSVIPLMPFNAFFPVLAGPDPAAVLPQAAAVGLRVLHRVRPRAHPGPLRRRPSTARRG